MEVTVYKVQIRFEKLFADPMIFDDPANLVRRYFLSIGIPPEKTGHLYQSTGDVTPVNDSGRPSVVSGTADYRYQGKRVRSDYMAGANLEINYADFGSGLSRDDHAKLWRKGRWGDMRFETKDFTDKTATIDLPDVAELYQMLSARATPTTLASVELENLPDSLFKATVSYLEERLKRLAEDEGAAVEVYATRDLAPEERKALEKRLTRESTDSTVHVILSKMETTKSHTTG